MRTLLLRFLKQSLHRFGNTKVGERILRLIAEEYAVNESAKAVASASPTLRETLRPVVLRGPFAGLAYPGHAAVGSSYWPKLLGSYECELASVIETIIANGYQNVIDIGAAEGYYAVGLAKRLPGARVVAFEGNRLGQQMLRSMAALNSVTVEINGWCNREVLAQAASSLARGKTLLLCDAESAEYDILDPMALPALREWDILIELHRRSTVGDPRSWVERMFGHTHDVTFVDCEARLHSAYPELRALHPSVRAHILFERTDHFGWAILMSREATLNEVGGE